MVRENRRSVYKAKYATLIILDIIHGLIFTLKASCSTFCIDYFECQPSLHISCAGCQGYSHLFRLSLSSVDKSLKQFGAWRGNVVLLMVWRWKTSPAQLIHATIKHTVQCVIFLTPVKFREQLQYIFPCCP